jgi:hypothetical protein
MNEVLLGVLMGEALDLEVDLMAVREGAPRARDVLGSKSRFGGV